MTTPGFSPAVCIACSAALLVSCASQPVAIAPGEIRVFYSTLHPDGSRLKEIPTEVTIVRRENTFNNVGVQVALNIFMLAMGGGFGVQGFSKDDLKGSSIDDAASRANLKNPVAGEFLGKLKSRIDETLRQDPEMRGRTYREPVLVAGGSTRLIYETLMDGEEERFRLKTSLQVYKKKESAGMFSFSPLVIVNCSDESGEPMPLDQWAEADFQPVKTQLNSLLSACEAKVMAELPALLKD